jgi:LacI family transcriptional regulator
MNIREIAKRAKVSTATASRAINRIPNVDPHMAKRVRKAVEELGYYPNSHARSLGSGKSRTFGLIVSEISNTFSAEVAQAFEDVAVQHDYEILITSTVHDRTRMEMGVRRMIERRVDGVAVLTFGAEESLIAALRLKQIPVVFVGVGLDSPGVSNIRIDYEHGIRQAVQHVAALRHVEIAFVAGPAYLNLEAARKTAFQQCMREIGMGVRSDMIMVSEHTVEGGMRAFDALRRLSTRPTAVLCSNDMTAIGIIRQAHECGVSIPFDMSVVGFDDIPLAQFTIPPLTTVQVSQTELAKLAFQALLSEAEDKSEVAEKREYTLITNLILRGSTALADSEVSLLPSAS